jgi:hypothetical protein
VSHYLEWAKRCHLALRPARLIPSIGKSGLLIAHDHTATTNGKDAIRQLPNEWRVADEDDLAESAKVHGPAQHAHVLLAIDSIQRSRRFVPE